MKITSKLKECIFASRLTNMHQSKNCLADKVTKFKEIKQADQLSEV